MKVIMTLSDRKLYFCENPKKYGLYEYHWTTKKENATIYEIAIDKTCPRCIIEHWIKSNTIIESIKSYQPDLVMLEKL